MNRRGQDFLVDFYVIFIFIIMLLIFFVLFMISKGDRTDNTVQDEFIGKDVDFALMSFLRAPNINDPERTVAETIADDFDKNDIGDTISLFQSFYSGYGGKYPEKFEDDKIQYVNIVKIKLCIYDKDDDFYGGIIYNTETKSYTTILKTPVGCGVTGNIAKSKTKIPTREGMIYVELVYFD